MHHKLLAFLIVLAFIGIAVLYEANQCVSGKLGGVVCKVVHAVA